jgi:hypothetical protein
LAKNDNQKLEVSNGLRDFLVADGLINKNGTFCPHVRDIVLSAITIKDFMPVIIDPIAVAVTSSRRGSIVDSIKYAIFHTNGANELEKTALETEYHTPVGSEHGSNNIVSSPKFGSLGSPRRGSLAEKFSLNSPSHGEKFSLHSPISKPRKLGYDNLESPLAGENSLDDFIGDS